MRSTSCIHIFNVVPAAVSDQAVTVQSSHHALAADLHHGDSLGPFGGFAMLQLAELSTIVRGMSCMK